jgi:formate transporter
MSFMKPEQIALTAGETGWKKAYYPILSKQLPLGFAAGAYIALGFLLAIRVSAGLPPAWSGLAGAVGAAVFPLGLILTLAAGGELLTGNMMTLSMACFQGKIPAYRVAFNWFWITIGNFAGALFVAYVFGHLVGLTEQGEYLARTLALAHGKLEEPFLAAFLSGVGCNWLVALAVWLAYGSKDGTGYVLGIWFPTMAFVAIGFQHVVANMFLIPAAIFAGHATWAEYIANFVPVFLGNAVGGALFVTVVYGIAYAKKQPTAAEKHGGTADREWGKDSSTGIEQISGLH